MLKIKQLIQHHQGQPDLTCPIFTCDICKKEIANAESGMYKWQQDAHGEAIPGTLVILCKGVCDRYHNRKHDAQAWPWHELRWIMGYLPNNTAVPWSYLIDDYCPDDQLDSVLAKVMQRIKQRNSAALDEETA